jgi:hypothetical protein
LKLTQRVNIYIPTYSQELLGFTRVCTLWLRTHQQGDKLSYHQKFDEPFGVWFHFFFFLKIKWEPVSVDMRVILLVEADTVGEYLHPYIESGTLRVYTRMYTMVLRTHQQRDGLSNYQNSTNLSALGSIFGRFFGNRCRLV